MKNPSFLDIRITFDNNTMKHRILQVFEHHLMKSYDRVYEK